MSQVESRFKDYVEHKSVQLLFSQNKVQLPASVRSTFLMVFSPDGQKVASTHGDHKIYISCIRSGRMLQTLAGHSRTPWSLAFHPSLRDVVASGCLAGEVRIWDLRSGACEAWINTHGTVIASLSFHPTDHLVLIATCNELHFWDWRQSTQPFPSLTTSSDKERVRFVKVDASGSKIITGISNLPSARPVPPFSFAPVVRSPSSTGPVIVPEVLLSAPSLSSLAHEAGRPNDPLLPYTSAGSAALRRSNLLNRVMSMSRQLEGIEAGALLRGVDSRHVVASAAAGAIRASISSSHLQLDGVDPESQVTRISFQRSAEQSSSSLSAGPSVPRSPVADYNNSLMATFRKLHSLCTRLAALMSEQQESNRLIVGTRDSRGGDATASLNELLSRLQASLQNMSSAALTTAIAQEHIQQVRQRVSEILDRLQNVDGYRIRLVNLRDQIYDVAERYAAGSEPELERSQRLDLLHCLCLVDMSITLTRQMHQILTRDYRLSQLTLSSAQNGGSASTASNSQSHSNQSSYSEEATTSRAATMSPASPPSASSESQAGESSSGSLSSSRSRFHPYNRFMLMRSRSSVSASSTSSSDSSTNFSIPLVRVSGPEDLSPTTEEQPESVFVREAFSRERPRSPPLPEIQNLLSYNTAAVPAAQPMPANVSPAAPDVRLRLNAVLGDGSPGARSGAHLWFQGPPLPAWPGGQVGAELSWLGSASSLTYRLQCWDYRNLELPNLKDSQANVVVSKCRIHNDASVDMNGEGTLLAALVPIENSASVNLCIYSLEKKSFAQCLFLWTFGANAISVSLSPLSRFVVVGLTTPRTHQPYSFPPSNESVTVGQVFQLNDREKESPSLEHVRNINVSRGDESFSLNSIRWLPNPGEGFIYGTNRGHLIICRPEASMRSASSKLMACGLRHSSTMGTQTFPSLTMAIPQRSGTSIGTQTQPDNP